MSFFSVIIPLYNKEKFIENTLKSVLNQRFTDFELIIINDGSTDQSETKVLKFNDDRIRYFSKENEGVSTARNFGIAQSASNYISFIDADDYWHPDFLQEMALAISQFPKEKIFSAAIEIETSKNTIPAQYSIQKKGNYQIVNYFEASTKESVIWTSCAVFDKEVFEKTGVFDTKIKSGQDIDLWIRIGLIYPVVFNPKILARYIYDRDSLSKKTEYTTQKLDFSKFKETEKSHPELKKFLDLNRFSLAIKCKLNHDTEAFEIFSSAINMKNLSVKKRILLLLPAFILKNLVTIKSFLANAGLGNSVFK